MRRNRRKEQSVARWVNQRNSGFPTGSVFFYPARFPRNAGVYFAKRKRQKHSKRKRSLPFFLLLNSSHSSNLKEESREEKMRSKREINRERTREPLNKQLGKGPYNPEHPTVQKHKLEIRGQVRSNRGVYKEGEERRKKCTTEREVV